MYVKFGHTRKGLSKSVLITSFLPKDRKSNDPLFFMPIVMHHFAFAIWRHDITILWISAN